MGLLGSGRGLNGRGAPVGSILVELQLKWCHGDPFRDQNHGFVRPVLLGTDRLLLGTDQLLLGTNQSQHGTDQSLLGTDQSPLGNDQ